jgi:hypothetical protein
LLGFFHHHLLPILSINHPTSTQDARYLENWNQAKKALSLERTKSSESERERENASNNYAGREEAEKSEHRGNIMEIVSIFV